MTPARAVSAPSPPPSPKGPIDFRAPRPHAKRNWAIAIGVVLAVSAGVIALRQPSELEACRATCFDAYARCSGVNAIQCSVVRGDCEAKCAAAAQESESAAAASSDDPALAVSRP